MKKKLYFTNAVPPEKSANSINTYVNLAYDTKTGELKLVDSFGGKLKELVIGTAEAAPEEDDTEPAPVPSGVGALNAAGALNVERTIATNKEAMFMKYGNGNYTFYESCIVLNDYLDSEDCDGSLSGISNIFQVVRTVYDPNTGEELGTTTEVTLYAYNAEGAYTEDTRTNAFWVGDQPLKDSDVAITFDEAFARLMQANIVKPHSKYCVLRKELGPLPGKNAQYVFGNTAAQVYVDAKTGEVSSHNPAFPVEVELSSPTISEDDETKFTAPLGEWP